MPEKLTIGGQAVIEGVMLRSPRYIVTSVRKENKKIVSKVDKIKKKPFWMQWFFIRGIINLVDMMYMGIKVLIWSGNEAGEEKEKLNVKDIIMLLLVSFSFAVIFFVALPYVLTVLIGIKEESSPVTFNLIDGLIKLGIFFIYLIALSFMKDVRRVFQYHGAEHATVHCYEHKKALTVQNVKKFSTIHPRCGTSFLMLVLITSIILFTLVPVIVISIFPNFINLGFLMRKIILFSLRILLIPVIAGISYELLKAGAKFENNIIFKIILVPGLLFQKITTQKPDTSQIEVAIDSMNKLLRLEKV